MTDDSPTLRDYSDVGELLAAAELRDVVVYETHARRDESANEKTSSMSLMTRVELRECEVRAQINVRGVNAVFRADAGAVFTLTDPGTIPESVMHEFSEKVGVMAVYPYLRACLLDMAGQLNVERPVLPLLRAGEVNLEPLEAQEETPAENASGQP